MTYPHLSARGRLILSHPMPDATGRWVVVMYNRRGQWQVMNVEDNRMSAKRRVSELFAMHRELAKEAKP